jgi:predicted permease
MRLLRTIRLRIRSLVHWRRVDQELDAELRDHLERQIEVHQAAGLSPAEARAAAFREFGNILQIHEQCRDARGLLVIDDLIRDVRHALRALSRAPAFSAVTILSLALAVGPNTAIFSLAYALMLRDLPVADPHQLVELGRATPYGRGNFSYPLFERLRNQNTVFTDALAMSTTTLQASVGDDTQLNPPTGKFVSGNFFEILGVPPLVGRVLTSQDDRLANAHGSAVAVISHGLWHRQFGGAPAVLGATLRVDTIPFTIVGILPPAFEGLQFGRRVDFFIPLASEPRLRRESWLSNPDFNWLAIVGRLKPGTSLRAARANLEAVFERSLEDVAATFSDADARRRIRTHRLIVESARAGLSELREQFSGPVLLLMGAVAIVLLIACANVVNLLLARGLMRRREIALRLAIGASRGRLVRQLLTESAVLGAGGGLVGLALATWAAPGVIALMAEGDPTLALDLTPDARILLFTCAVAVGSALLAGLVPALRATGTSITPAAEGDARTVGASRRSARWSQTLVVAQVAMSLLLLASASLVLMSLYNLRALDPGFDRDHVLLLSLNPGKAGYRGERAAQYYRDVLARVRRAPGVRATTLCLIPPISGGGVDLPFAVEGQPREPGALVYVHDVADGYFSTMSTGLLLGRDFSPHDGVDSPPVAVINEAFARSYLDSTASPIGRRVALGGQEGLEIVGVVPNAKYLSLREDDRPIVYVHVFQRREAGDSLTLAVRTSGDPMAASATVRREVLAVAPAVPVGQAATLAAQINRSLVKERLVTRILGAFAGLALVLACIGLYGVLGYAVTRRTNEIGVRLALGATRGVILQSVLRDSAWLVAIGAAIGVTLALMSTRLVSTLLYGVTPTDPWLLGGAVLCLVLVALIAASVPAWRASRIDPLVALRHE